MDDVKRWNWNVVLVRSPDALGKQRRPDWGYQKQSFPEETWVGEEERLRNDDSSCASACPQNLGVLSLAPARSVLLVRDLCLQEVIEEGY